MSRWWAIPMLLSGGLFAGGVVSTAWERVPAWRASDLVDFRTGFAHTLRRVDCLQPALLVVCLGAAIGVASSTGDAARALAVLAAGGFLLVLVGSVAWLVPIQRRLVASGAGTATGGPRSVENQVAWRPPGPHRRRAGLLRHGRPRHRRMRTPTTTGSGMA